MNKPQILVVENDKTILNLVTTVLKNQGYQVRQACDSDAAVMEALSYRPDVILLELGLPTADILAVIQRIRASCLTPIIALSDQVDDQSKIAALDAGADDYVTKPFSVDELMARLRVAVRRSRILATRSGGEITHYENGELSIDFDAGCVYLGGNEVHLTPTEYKVLCLLARNTGKVLTRNYILKEVWGEACEADIPTLRVTMATLRKKIEVEGEPGFIQTHIGIGYRLLRKE